ncbi:MAG: hypothetical protein A2315_00180 [Ignavibacteria bacterium RIFOXYB2_FULL_35_12]|nr:MAG: hypothetical protein A2058_09605 [Ignavibacteria bacterium GWA2_36_19]OGU48986.1 MAG: hypothetical protein A2006_11580 [Ignavibacteria bacterium GWC2_35_8]OGU57629.1 MAG: hypothetical protein A2X60_05255 [Ignavibacteria bacterium GWF2_35_20]OGU82108.1 MAG: hypothetical protein A2254_13085 [Ignavibacteria bacterium RIFOXYA2_FULL_35_9]OGU84449.1 MAG: hypothetical protein A3K31_11070 [Ignavibacteria bacterium RIFOXYA12_FULL_35_25]OGU95274.1 MAG: hypothetical protein A2347_13395 [Ignavibac
MDERNFISLWIQNLKTESIKNFPADFIVTSEFKNYNLPGNGLLIGKEFFGDYELISAEGSEVLRVESYEKAKYFIYANRNKPKILAVPIDETAIRNMNKKYEKYLDSIIKRIDQDYRSKFPGAKNFSEILNQIFNHLNLIRLK